MNNSPTFSLLKVDRADVFVVVAIVVIALILFTIFYMIAVTSHPQIVPPKPSFGSPFPLFQPMNFTTKLIHKIGWHACQDAPDTLCYGTFTIKVMVPGSTTLHAPS